MLVSSVMFAQTDDISKQLCDCSANVKDLPAIEKTLIFNALAKGQNKAIQVFINEIMALPEAEGKKAMKSLRSDNFKKADKSTKKCVKALKKLYQKLPDADKNAVDAKVINDDTCSFSLKIIQEKIKK